MDAFLQWLQQTDVLSIIIAFFSSTGGFWLIARGVLVLMRAYNERLNTKAGISQLEAQNTLLKTQIVDKERDAENAYQRKFFDLFERNTKVAESLAKTYDERTVKFDNIDNTMQKLDATLSALNTNVAAFPGAVVPTLAGVGEKIDAMMLQIDGFSESHVFIRAALTDLKAMVEKCTEPATVPTALPKAPKQPPDAEDDDAHDAEKRDAA